MLSSNANNEREANKTFLELYIFPRLGSETQPSDNLQELLLNVFDEQQITLGAKSATGNSFEPDLTDEDKIADLTRIIARAPNTDNPDGAETLTQALSEWINSVSYLKSGAGSPLALGHASQGATSIVQTRRDGSDVAVNYWLTDYDMDHVLQGQVTEIDQLNEAGIYLLPRKQHDTIFPESIGLLQSYQSHLDKQSTDSIDPLVELTSDQQQSVAFAVSIIELQHTLAARNFSGASVFLIPISSGTHWRLAKLRFEGSELVSADLFNPISADSDTNPIFVAFKQAIQLISTSVEPTASSTNIQHNSSSCGDFVIQQALKELGVKSSSIVRAGGDATALRQAVIHQACENQGITPPQPVPSPSNYDQLTIIDPQLRAETEALFGELNARVLSEEVEIITDSLAERLAELQPVQEGFDRLLATELNAIYEKADSNVATSPQSEESMVRKATTQALALSLSKFSFFSPERKTPCAIESQQEMPTVQSPNLIM